MPCFMICIQLKAMLYRNTHKLNKYQKVNLSRTMPTLFLTISMRLCNICYPSNWWIGGKLESFCDKFRMLTCLTWTIIYIEELGFYNNICTYFMTMNIFFFLFICMNNMNIWLYFQLLNFEEEALWDVNWY